MIPVELVVPADPVGLLDEGLTGRDGFPSHAMVDAIADPSNEEVAMDEEAKNLSRSFHSVASSLPAEGSPSAVPTTFGPTEVGDTFAPSAAPTSSIPHTTSSDSPAPIEEADKQVVNEETDEDNNAARVASVIYAGAIITIRAHSGRKCAERDDVGWQCNRKTSSIRPSQRFTVENVADDKFALRNSETGQLCSDEGRRIVCDHQGLPGRAEMFSVLSIGNDKFALVGGKDDRFCVDRGDRVSCDQRAHSPDDAQFDIECVQNCHGQESDVPALPSGAVVTIWNPQSSAFVAMKGSLVFKQRSE